MGLHLTLGPAATSVSEIARVTGVQRVTVYNHFPDEGSLFAACSGHWRAMHPAPDPATWVSIAAPARRIRRVLRDLYAWYRETEPMTANVLRDAEVLPALRAVVDAGLTPYLDAVCQIIAAPFAAGGRRGDRVDAAARAAASFHFSRALASLGDAEAAELGAGLVEIAARTRKASA